MSRETFYSLKKEGAIRDDFIIGEIGDVLTGKIEGRRSEQELTLFKALGLSIEDLASAQLIYQKAIKTSIGMLVEFGGGHLAGKS